MTLKLVILKNIDKQVVEMYNGKEYVIKTGENILPDFIARAFLARTNRTYKIIGPAETQNTVCPLCGQIVKFEKDKEDKETKKLAVKKETPRVPVQEPVQSSKEEKLKQTEEKKVE